VLRGVLLVTNGDGAVEDRVRIEENDKYENLKQGKTVTISSMRGIWENDDWSFKHTYIFINL